MTNSQLDPQSTGPDGTSSSKVNGNGNGHDAHALAPWRPEARRIPEGAYRQTKPAHEPFEKPSTTDLAALWAALRRRWFLASFLGLTFACIAAGATWLLMPTKFVTFSELFVSSRLDNIIWDEGGTRDDFATYKQTAMKKVFDPFVINAALRRPEISQLTIVQEQENPPRWIEQELKVESPAMEFIKISMASTNPREATALVNAITEEFIRDTVDNERQDALSLRSRLESLQNDNENAIVQQRNQLKRLTEALKTNTPEIVIEHQRLQVLMLSETAREQARLQFQIMQLQAQLDARAAGAEGETPVEIPEPIIEYQVAQAPEVQKLEIQKKELEELIVRTQKAVKGDDHPLLVKHRASLETIEKDLEEAKASFRPVVIEKINLERQLISEKTEEQLKREITALTHQEQSLGKRIEEMKENAKSYNLESYDMENLRMEIERKQETAKKLGDELQRVTIALTQRSRVSLHRKAEVPSEPEMKRKYMMTAFAGFGVLGLIVGGIVWLESAARRISTAKEITNGLQLPIMGSLPVMPNWLVQGKNKGRRNGRSAVWQSVWTESIDSARTMMLRDAAVESRQVVMVASAMSGEGKTTLASHLATSLARAGRKTLLVDGDLRRPSIHKMFSLNFKPGVCEVMRGEVALEDAVQMSPQENLYILPAGHLTQAVLTMLAQGDIAELFEPLRSHFDFIVVDSSPILPVTDSLLIGQHVDAVIFSIRRDVSRYAKVATAYHRLSMLGVPVLGAVAIGMDQETYGSMYGGRYGYSRSYHYYNSPPEDVIDGTVETTTPETADS